MSTFKNRRVDLILLFTCDTWILPIRILEPRRFFGAFSCSLFTTFCISRRPTRILNNTRIRKRNRYKNTILNTPGALDRKKKMNNKIALHYYTCVYIISINLSGINGGNVSFTGCINNKKKKILPSTFENYPFAEKKNKKICLKKRSFATNLRVYVFFKIASNNSLIITF